MIRKRTVTAVVGAISAVALGVVAAPPASAAPTISLNCPGFGSGDAEIEPFGAGEFAMTTTVPAPQPSPGGIPVELQTSVGSFTSVTLASTTSVQFDDFSGPAVTTANVTTSHDFIIHAPDIGDVTCDVTTGGTINW